MLLGMVNSIKQKKYKLNNVYIYYLMEDILASYIEFSKLTDSCYYEYNILIKYNCNYKSNNDRCKLLSKLYDNCIKQQYKKLKSVK